MLRARLQCDKQTRLDRASPTRDIFQRTQSLLTALRKVGCGFPAHEPTQVSMEEQVQLEKMEAHEDKTRRGYKPISPTCKGQILFQRGRHGHPFIRWVDQSLSA